jgi:hypothetical protein
MKNSSRWLFLVVLSLAFAGASDAAFAHGGGGGRSYTATGPATYLPAPALQYYGGFDGVPLALQPAAPTTFASHVAAPQRQFRHTTIVRTRRRHAW